MFQKYPHAASLLPALQIVSVSIYHPGAASPADTSQGWGGRRSRSCCGQRQVLPPSWQGLSGSNMLDFGGQSSLMTVEEMLGRRCISDSEMISVCGNVWMQCKINVLPKIYVLAKYFDRVVKVTVRTTPSGSSCLLPEYLYYCFGEFMYRKRLFLCFWPESEQLFVVWIGDKEERQKHMWALKEAFPCFDTGN